MGLKELQKKIYQNKINRGFNTTDIGKEIVLMTEELGELAKAFKKENKSGIVDAVGDLMVYCLGLCEILGVNSEEILKSIVENNEKRDHEGYLKKEGQELK